MEASEFLKTIGEDKLTTFMENELRPEDLFEFVVKLKIPISAGDLKLIKIRIRRKRGIPTSLKEELMDQIVDMVLGRAPEGAECVQEILDKHGIRYDYILYSRISKIILIGCRSDKTRLTNIKPVLSGVKCDLVIKILTGVDFYAEPEVKASIIASKLGVGPKVYLSGPCKDDSYQDAYFLIEEFITGMTLSNWVMENYEKPRFKSRYDIIINKIRDLYAKLIVEGGVMYEDTKADNIMIRANDDPVLIDYGIVGVGNPRPDFKYPRNFMPYNKIYISLTAPSRADDPIYQQWLHKLIETGKIFDLEKALSG